MSLRRVAQKAFLLYATQVQYVLLRPAQCSTVNGIIYSNTLGVFINASVI